MTNILRVIPDAFGFNLAGAASFLDEEIDDDVDASRDGNRLDRDDRDDPPIPLEDIMKLSLESVGSGDRHDGDGTVDRDQATNAAPDDPSAKEYQEYRIRLGRWRRDTIAAILSPIWWLVHNIVTRLHGPLTHHFAYIRTSNVCPVLAEMTCVKAQEICKEFESLVSNKSSWAKTIALSFLGCGEALPGAVTLSDILELGVCLNLHHHAAYSRRVVRDTQRFPLALFWLAYSPPNICCKKRQSIATFVLNSNPDCLEANARKLRGLAYDEFQQMAASGVCGPILYSIMLAVTTVAKGDVAINEGHNSLIKSIVQRCRCISLPLLSARSNCKKELKVGVRGAPTKWSGVKKEALLMVQDSVENYRAAFEKVLSDPDRFSCSIDCERQRDIDNGFNLPADEQITSWASAAVRKQNTIPGLTFACEVDTADASDEARAWGYVQSVRLHRMKQSISAETCVALGSLTDKDSRGHVIQSTAWMITDKNYSLAMLTKLQVIPVSDCRQDLIEAAAMCNPPGTQVDFILLPAKPLCTIPSTDWFSAIVYEKLVADEKREVATFTPKIYRYKLHWCYSLDTDSLFATTSISDEFPLLAVTVSASRKRQKTDDKGSGQAKKYAKPKGKEGEDNQDLDLDHDVENTCGRGSSTGRSGHERSNEELKALAIQIANGTEDPDLLPRDVGDAGGLHQNLAIVLGAFESSNDEADEAMSNFETWREEDRVATCADMFDKQEQDLATYTEAVVMETVEPREHPSDDREALLQAQYDKELGIDSKSLGCHGSGREFESEPADMNDMSSVCGDKSSESPELTVAERERQQQLKNIKFWIAECDAGRKALEDRITDNNTTTTPGGPWPHELSLVATYPTKSDTVLKSTDTATTGAGVTRCRPCSNYNVNGNATLLVVAWNDSKGYRAGM